MRERRRAARASAVALAVVFAAPLLVLPLQAATDAWHAPALLPQRLGTRGVQIAVTGQAGEALGNSLLIALGTTTLALPLGWPAARALAGRRLRRPTPVLVLLALPLLVPAYATGTGLAEWMVRLGLAGTRLGLVLAHLTVVLPYVVLVLAAGFGERLGDLEETGRTMGLGRPRRLLLLVTLPATRPTLAAAHPDRCGLDLPAPPRSYGVDLMRPARTRHPLLTAATVAAALAGYTGYLASPRFDLPRGAGAGLLLLAAAAGIASFFSPCSSPLLLSVLARAPGGAGKGGIGWALGYAVALAAGAAGFLLLAGGVVAVAGTALFAGVTFTSTAGRLIRAVVGVGLLLLGLIQLGRLPVSFRRLEPAIHGLLRRQAGLRRRPLLGHGMFGFGYVLAGFG
jgi:ABC-type spermidine/putrescine transport system permease subunit II/cytochrome c biogenesis protein CcdA